MGTYRGQTYLVPCNRGGWVPNANADLIPPESMAEAININLHNGGRETRGGVERVNATPIADSPRIMGEFQFRKKNGTEFIVTGTADGKIQSNYSTVLKTGLTVNRVYTFEVFKDKLYISNGVDVPQVWDGVDASTSDLANIPSDWTGSNFPTKIVKHGRGASERLWATGVRDNPGVYASATGTDDFSDANVVFIPIETGDGFGIISMEEFGEVLILIGKRRAYIIDDTSPDTTAWGYRAAQWEGGIGGLRLLVKTPNDLIGMAEDGEIYSILTTQEIGDYRVASISRPAHLHVWIKDNLDLSKMADFHMVYDPILRAIKIFVIRKGQIQVDTALVYFIDRPAEEAWTRHRYAAQVFLSSSALVRVSAGDWKVYAGGYAGHVYKLESDVLLDDGVHYDSSFMTIDDPFANPRVQKRYDRDWVIASPQGGEVIGINVFVDGRPIIGEGFFLVDELGNNIVDESGNKIVSQSGVSWLITPEEGNRLSNEDALLGIIGIRKQTEVRQIEPGKKMFISQLMSDHTVLGPRAGRT